MRYLGTLKEAIMWDCHFILTFKKLGQMLVSALWHRIGQQARVNFGEKCKTYFKTTREGKVKAKAKIGNDFKDIGLLQTAQGEWVGHGQSGCCSISHGTSNPNCLTWCPGCRCRRSCESWRCSLQFKVPFCSKCYVVPGLCFSTQTVRRTLKLSFFSAVFFR